MHAVCIITFQCKFIRKAFWEACALFQKDHFRARLNDIQKSLCKQYSLGQCSAAWCVRVWEEACELAHSLL